MASPAPPPDPLPANDDRGPALTAMFWAWSGVSLLLVSLRFYARIRIRALGWDDWMMLLSVILLVVTASFITYMASIGGSRHVWYLDDAEVLKALKWSWISQPPTLLLFATAKTSIAILVLRLIRRSTVWRRYIIYAVIVVVFLANILTIVFTFAQCNPARALWTPSLVGKCWPPYVQERLDYFFSALNILADIVLAILPSTFIPSLSLPLGKKIALCVLLGFGIIAAVFGIIKAVYLHTLTERGDFTWNAYEIQVWSGAEAFVLIFCGNLPPLQPLWERLFSDRDFSSYGRTPAKYAVSDNFSSSHKSSGGGAFSSAATGHSRSSMDEYALLESAGNIRATTRVTVSTAMAEASKV